MSFWKSTLGEIDGSEENSFAKSFSIIPNGTRANATIKSFKNDNFNGRYLQIEWLIADGEFKFLEVRQKIKVFDQDEKTQFRALNMLKRIYTLFDIKPKHELAPNDDDLQVFINKKAGIVIGETEPNDKGRQYNYVAEVHDPKGFEPMRGPGLPLTSKKNKTTAEDVYIDYSNNMPSDDIGF